MLRRRAPPAFAALHMVCRRVVRWAVWVPRERRLRRRRRSRIPRRPRGPAGEGRAERLQGKAARAWRIRQKCAGLVRELSCRRSKRDAEHGREPWTGAPVWAQNAKALRTRMHVNRPPKISPNNWVIRRSLISSLPSLTLVARAILAVQSQRGPRLANARQAISWRDVDPGIAVPNDAGSGVAGLNRSARAPKPFPGATGQPHHPRRQPGRQTPARNAPASPSTPAPQPRRGRI
jgi:hypothetical protein